VLHHAVARPEGAAARGIREGALTLAQRGIAQEGTHGSRACPQRGLIAYDFGGSWGAMNGPWIAAAAFATVAFGLQLEFPSLWPAWLDVAMLGVNGFVGGLLLRSSRRTDFASLPLVDFLSSDHDRVLDAGCGGGRTTLALSKVLKNGRVVAIDRFDACYIDGGGRAVLERPR